MATFAEAGERLDRQRAELVEEARRTLPRGDVVRRGNVLRDHDGHLWQAVHILDPAWRDGTPGLWHWASLPDVDHPNLDVIEVVARKDHLVADRQRRRSEREAALIATSPMVGVGPLILARGLAELAQPMVRPLSVEAAVEQITKYGGRIEKNRTVQVPSCHLDKMATACATLFLAGRVVAHVDK